MANSIPLTFRAAPFPEGYKAEPEQLKNDIVARLYAESTEAISFFAAGSVAPSSNVGPWLRNGQTWYVWDDGLAMYVPQVLAPESLGYTASAVAPDQTIYTFWIELNGSGKAIAIKYYSGGAWKDVYEDKFATFQTTAGMASYSTTTQMDAAIAAAIAAIPSSNSYRAQAVAGPQTIAIDGNQYKLAFSTAIINPAPAPFDTTNRRYIAPADGGYWVSVSTQWDNDTGTPSGMEVSIALYKNGVYVGNQMGDIDSTPSPNGARWSPGFSGLVELVETDYLEIYASINDGVNAGNITLTGSQFSIAKVP